MNTDNCITLENVAIGYSGKVLLKDINFSLKAGEFIVLFGPNGSGKTTLFKTILRIIPPIQGHDYLRRRSAHTIWLRTAASIPG